MTSPASSPEQTTLLVDGHVHLHSCFELPIFLSAALQNFQTQSQQLQLNAPLTGALLLAEVSGINAFSAIAQQHQTLSQQLTEWDIELTQEACSIWAKHVEGHAILIAAGRQVVTAEGIEVLALITDNAVEDGRSLTETLAAVEQAQGLSVLPWGVGKWIGKRGNLVQAELENASRELLFAGDNGGRPGFWTLPNYFQHRPQLPGSDPLPMPDEVNRAGSFGFVTQGKLDHDYPGRSLQHILKQTQPYIQPYGRTMSPFKFVKNQSLIRLK